MKKIISIIFAMLFIVSMFSLHTEASSKPIKVFQDGKELKFDIDPIVENGRTLVELRGIFEAFGVKLTYDSSTKVIKGEHEYNNVSLTIGSNIAQVGNQKVTLEVPAKVINGRTVVPLRFIGEAIRTNVQWNPNERNIVLTTPIDGNKINNGRKETINPIENTGELLFSDGGKYVGEIKNDTPNGYGKFYDSRGALVYEGNFLEGNPHGEGRGYHPNGMPSYLGNHKNGKFDGYGEFYLDNGYLGYKGYYKDGKMHGQGALYDKGEILYLGDFNNGEPHGWGALYDQNGIEVFQGEFRYGKPIY